MNRLSSFGVVLLITLGIGGTLFQATSTEAFKAEDGSRERAAQAPIAISGDNIYVAWWTNKSGNNEVMFRASPDGGETFGDKINLSNTTDRDSVDVEINADAETVAVTWWERSNQINEPVLRVSTDSGVTFGPILELGTNGTIGTGEAKPLGQ